MSPSRDVAFQAPGNALLRLVLLGTIHLDPDGRALLTDFLRRFGPDMIFLELSPYALRYRKSHRRRLLKRMARNLRLAARHCGISPQVSRSRPEIQSIRRQIGLPYEYRATAAYARRSGIRLLLVDRSEFSRELIQSWAELISPKNLATLLTTPRSTRSIEAMRQSAKRRIHADTPDPSFESTGLGANARALWEEREAQLARRIVSGLEMHHPRRPLYVGGFQHLTRGGTMRTLREILVIPPERCVLL